MTKEFHNPFDFGILDITTSQTNKLLSFAWDTTVLSECTIVAVGSTVIKTYTVGDGITLSDNNGVTNGRVDLVINGDSFAQYVGRTIKFKCNFFVKNDEEVNFSLEIIKGFF
jgi:hypothetical protein